MFLFPLCSLSWMLSFVPNTSSRTIHLEDHTRLFLMLANTTSYPEDTLCSFYDASLNTACRTPLSKNGPVRRLRRLRGVNFWQIEDRHSPSHQLHTPDPEPSPPTPRSVEPMPEATDDRVWVPCRWTSGLLSWGHFIAQILFKLN